MPVPERCRHFLRKTQKLRAPWEFERVYDQKHKAGDDRILVFAARRVPAEATRKAPRAERTGQQGSVSTRGTERTPEAVAAATATIATPTTPTTTPDAAITRADPVATPPAVDDLTVTRFGLSVSRKQGNAVRRARLKRLLREAFRLSQYDLPDGVDLVLIPRQGSNATPAEFAESLVRLSRRLAQRLPREG